MEKNTQRRSHLLRVLGATTMLAGIAVPTMGRAQSAPDATAAAPAPAGDSQGLGEIVVTATHEKQSIQKVPISMLALDSAKLAEHQIKGLSDITQQLPSVSIAGIGPGRSTPYFRGIVPAGGNYASVGYYLDDIPITGTSPPDIHIYDIDHVEALAGPQGTLYGAGSLSGTIRFITNKPKIGRLEAGIDLEANKYGGHGEGGQIEAYFNLPITNTLAVRVMGFYDKQGGYINNTPNNGKFNTGAPAVLNLGDDVASTSYTLNNAALAKNNYNPVYEYGTRIEALWEPAPGWEIMPEITAQRQTAYGYFGYDPRVGDLDVHDYDTTRQDDRWYQAELSVHGHIGDFDLVSTTGYFYRRIYLNNDYTYYTVTYDSFGPGYENYLQFFDKKGCTGSGASEKCSTLINPTQYYHSWQTQSKFTQEVRVKTPKTWPFDATVGGFFQSQFYENNSNYAIHGLDNIAGYTEAGGQESNPAGFGIPVSAGGTMITGTNAVKGDAFYINENNQYYHDEAVFAEGHYNITPKLKLTGGIRYFWTDFETLGFAGVTASAQSTSSSLNTLTGTYGCPTPLPAARLTCLNTNPAAADEVGRYSQQGQTHKAAIDWQFDSDKMLYFNYSTGFRPGGFNRPLRVKNVGLVKIAPYQAETLSNFELGLKSSWHNIFRLNLAAYYEKWNNVQYSVVVAGTQGAGMTGNAGTANVKGAEYDASLKLGKFTLSTTGAYNDARLAKNFCNFALNTATLAITQLPACTPGQAITGDNLGTPQVAATAGTRLPRQPMFKGNSSIRYDSMVGEYKIFAMASMNYQTGATQNLNTTLDGLLGDTSGFATVDFSEGVEKGPYHVELFINNAFDKRGILTKNTFCSITFCSNSSRSFPVKPQFFGIRMSYKYQ